MLGEGDEPVQGTSQGLSDKEAQQDQAQRPDTGLACLVMLLKYLGKAAEPEQIKHQRGKGNDPFSIDDILLACKQVEVKARSKAVAWKKLAKMPLPAIGRDKDGQFFIIAKIAEAAEEAVPQAEEEGGARDRSPHPKNDPSPQTKILVQSPLSQKPQILTEAEFRDLWSGDVVLMTTRAMLAGAARKFDVTWFIPAIVKYRKILYEILLASFFLQLFALMTPMFFQVVIDKVLVHKGLTTLDVMILALVVVSVFEVVVGGLRTYVFSHTTNRVDVELGAKLFRHLLALPLSYFESRRVGDSVARVRELDTIREFLTSSSVTLVIDVLFTFVFLAVMYLYSPTLLVIVLISLPCYVLVSIIVTPILRKRLEDKFQRGARNQAFLVETVTGVQTLKAMAVEPQMQRKWEENLAGYVHSGFKAAMLGNIGSQAVQFINKITTAVTLFWGATLVIEGAITVGQLVAFNMLAGRVSGPVLRLAQMWQDFQQARISVERLGDILNSPTEPTYNPNRTTLPDIKGRVEFDGVTFRYKPDGAEVLRRVSLVIPEGQVVGIVGPSGSGKSTLTKLVQRLYVPESGRVLVDGVDLAMVDPAWLRRQVGVVLQENLLFNKTVRENIALADPTIPMERVIAAAKMAGAHEFILEQAEGYDTYIDERGANLSGGQRQRIAIARALITNPRILILDEATSALDAESEEIIQENLKLIARGRTVIIIAHRLSAIKQASRILTVERGEITEDGTHAELMKQDGRYADLYKRQMRAASAEGDE
ncbi:type I secretion system permease/ATPase [Paremcibacter congregatus]|uniref:Type I secretion system permease/ATPase n=1 Tax=Paremcibacter congregatus TaxID=2043170 RepID=A0A2G4YP04_9PROT|nr:type I secretion system permease/ATPase [Paremcibacter congregatus]PHZ84025.1 type I secretion system permease/ATPase [Paremcibacter congregatus]QDE26294.1 type I secretion system permease/ATPase [Paremcibacter congregatus]